MVHIVVYDSVNHFLNENKSLLLDKESVSQLLLFNAMINADAKTSDALLFGKIADEKGNTKLLFCNCLPYNLLMIRTNEDSLQSDGAPAEFAKYLVQKDIYIKGINANKTICDEFISAYMRYQQTCTFAEHLAMDIMELRQVKELVISEGYQRLAGMEEVPLIARWIVAFARDALGEELIYEEQLLRARKLIEEDKIYLFININGAIVSMAAASRQLIHGVSINFVYTPKEYRGYGYAAANMYLLGKEMLKRGNQFCTLFVDKKNPISNRVYKKVGYEIIEDQYDYRLQ